MAAITQPGVIKITKALNKKDRERIKLAFEKAYTGPQKPGKVLIIKKGLLVKRNNSFFQRFRDLVFGSITVEFF